VTGAGSPVSRSRRRGPTSDVTVVVATRNRARQLGCSLPRHEAPVIVVDNGSEDDTVDVVARHRGVELIALGRNRGSAARTIGARAATTPLVAFADDDSWWAPGALAAGVEIMQRHPDLALVNARILVGPEERVDPVCSTLAASPLGASGPATAVGPRILGFVACATLVRRDAFLDVGGFDEVVRFPGEEERVAIDLAAAGWDLRYAPALTVHHHPAPGRDPSARRRAIVRSHILTALMRRPWPCAWARLIGAWRAGGAAHEGARAALRDAPRAVRARRLVPVDVETQLRLLERATGT
jgi:GT2 family glycosyltransferase